MPKRLSNFLVILCVLIALVECALHVSGRSLISLRLLFAEGAGLAGVLLWRTSLWRTATVIGFLVPAAIPFGLGLYIMAQQLDHVASLQPGESACGMGVLMASPLILIVAPVCGLTGAAIVAAGCAIDRTIANQNQTPAPPAP